MTQQGTETAPAGQGAGLTVRDRGLPYNRWMESLGVPIHRGYFIEDARTIEVGPWDERGCNAAFLEMAGMKGVVEGRITEIPPGGSTAPMKFALDEAVYVLDGQGLTTVWAEGVAKKTFEWSARSMFLIPRGAYRQFSNARGDRPARLLHNNNLPVAMSLNPDPDFYFNNPYEAPALLEAKEGEPLLRGHEDTGGPRLLLVRQLLLGHGCVGRAGAPPAARRRRPRGGRSVSKLGDQRPHVRLSALGPTRRDTGTVPAW